MREYGIDLMERIDGMSWRRFSALARNLSPFGAAARRAERLRSEWKTGNDRESAEAFFTQMRGGE